MSIKISVLSLTLVAAVLAGCGGTPEPAPKTEAKKTSVAGSFSADKAPADTSAAAAPAAEPAALPNAQHAEQSPPPGVPPPGQTVPVGIAPPGGVAFGPAVPGTDPTGDAERAQLLKERQEDDARRAAQASAARTAPADAPKRKQ